MSGTRRMVPRGPSGFTAESFDFLAALKAKNAKSWFDAHKADYEAFIKTPSSDLRERLATGLSDLTKTPIGSKTFRLNRDLRFSKDKTPYNTHVRMAFWPEGAQFTTPSCTPPSFFLSLEPDLIQIGTGCRDFSKVSLEAYRAVLASPRSGQLLSLLDDLTAAGFQLSKPELARPPKGSSTDARLADLSRHKSLSVWQHALPTDLAIGPQAADRLLPYWHKTLGLWTWLAELEEKP